MQPQTSPSSIAIIVERTVPSLWNKTYARVCLQVLVGPAFHLWIVDSGVTKYAIRDKVGRLSSNSKQAQNLLKERVLVTIC